MIPRVPFTAIRDILFTFEPHNEISNQRVVEQIRKAWTEGGGIDDFGTIWVDIRFLHTILRTTRIKANRMYNNAPDRFKRIINGKRYLNGAAVIGMLGDERTTSATRTRYDYLGVSMDSYRDIDRSSDVGELRDRVRADRAKKQRNLKKDRKKRFGVTKDELTGEPLDDRTSEFSHIRSFSCYPELGLCVENGLLVNKTTHEVITALGISDEDELFRLCREKGWSTEWYGAYKEWLKGRP